MGDKGSFWLPEQASTIAPDVDWLFYFVFWTSVVILIGVVVAMCYFAWRYRRKSHAERPDLVNQNKLVEASWIVIPTILVLMTFVWGFQAFIKIETAPPDAYQITVRAEQWKWNFEYPNGTTITNELHVPAGRPVQLRMSSSDVIHSFFVPAFRVKQDVLPNRYTSLWFETDTDTDTLMAHCTEYCGTGHSDMGATVIVQDQDDFNKWVETGGGTANLPPAEYGEILYERQACNTCHTLDGSAGTGPSWKGLYGHEVQLQSGQTVTADENYLRESILQSGSKIVAGFGNNMPANYSSLSERQVSSLIAFIKKQ